MFKKFYVKKKTIINLIIFLRKETFKLKLIK